MGLRREDNICWCCIKKMSVPESFKKKQARDQALAKAAAEAEAAAAKVMSFAESASQFNNNNNIGFSLFE